MAFCRVIAGLGNPGARYQGTRHNIGFEIVDDFVALASSSKREGFSLNADWQEKDGALRAELALAGEKIYVIKPLTFMNLSGVAVSALTGFYKIAPEEVAVVCDDIDLPLSTIRLKQGGGEGGHNGLRSISERLGSKSYIRVRIGVGRPNFGSDGSEIVNPAREKEIAAWVLEKFDSQDRNILAEVKSRALEALLTLTQKGLKTAQNAFNS